MVKTGDSIPNVDLVEGSPSDKVNLSKELASGKGLIVGIPAAFSEYLPPPQKHQSAPAINVRRGLTRAPSGPSCSATHIPGYVSHDKLKDAGKVFVVSVNDPFV